MLLSIPSFSNQQYKIFTREKLQLIRLHSREVNYEQRMRRRMGLASLREHRTLANLIITLKVVGCSIHTAHPAFWWVINYKLYSKYKLNSVLSTGEPKLGDRLQLKMFWGGKKIKPVTRRKIEFYTHSYKQRLLHL